MKFLIKRFPRVNFYIIYQEFIYWFGLGIFLYTFGKFLDYRIFNFFAPFRNEILDKIIIFSTERLLYIILGVLVLIMFYRIWKNIDRQTKLIPAFFAVITTGITTYILKSFFEIPRPYIIMSLEPLVEASGFSFPSGHTATAFALLIPFWRVSKILGIIWMVFALFMGFSRVYEIVHFPSDVAGGIFLGGIIGAIFSHPEIQKWIKILWEKNLEFRRQSFHFIFGMLCVFTHWRGILNLPEIAILLIIGLFISFFTQHKKPKFLTKILNLFDRPRDKKFPGRGAFYFLFSVFLCFLLFPTKIAYASILILSVGDSLNHLFTKKLQHIIRIPWNKRKNISGVVLGIALGTFAAQFFVPIFPAFIASTIALFIETYPVKIGKFFIDDNIFVPLIAGGILMLLV